MFQLLNTEIVLTFSYLYIALAGHSPEIIRTELDGSNATKVYVNVSDPLGLSISGDILTIADRRYENSTVETVFLKYNTVKEEEIDSFTTNKVPYFF